MSSVRLRECVHPVPRFDDRRVYILHRQRREQHPRMIDLGVVHVGAATRFKHGLSCHWVCRNNVVYPGDAM